MRIWITAVGVVSPLAAGAEATTRALLSGRRAVGPVSLFDASNVPIAIAAEVPGLRVSDVAPAGDAPRWSRADAMALVAAREALRDAGRGDAGPVDLVVGATTGGLLETEELVVAMRQHPSGWYPDPRLTSLPISSTADRLREAAWPFRRVETVCNACASGATAIALAGAWLRSGRSARVLAGGVDTLCRLTLVGFNLLGALDREPCRPFDRAHAGMTLGEGAAFVLLERDEVARARGAEPIAELAGWALGSEGRNAIQPEPDGRTAARVMSLALSRAGVAPADVGYVNAHGTGGAQGDRSEIAALDRLFDGAARRPAVSSTKGQIGHALGASPALQLALTATLLARGEVPHTAGLESPAEGCAADHVMGGPTTRAFDAALCNALGFGGADAALLVTRPGRFPTPARNTPRGVVVTGGAALTAAGLSALRDAHELLAAGPPPEPGPCRVPHEPMLDPFKSRRLDRASARAVAAAQSALGDARAAAATEHTALVTGSGLRSTAFAAFLEPILAGDWLAGRPIDYPNLLNSSAAANASIYLGVRGPVFAVAALECSGLGAVIAAAELVAAGEAERAVAVGVSELEPLLDGCLAPLLCERPRTGPLTEAVAAAVVGACAEGPAPDGAGREAELGDWASSGSPEAVQLAPPRDATRALLVLPRADASLLDALAGSPWLRAPRSTVSARIGENEACGTVALVAAASAIAAGRCDEALVIDRTPHRWLAVVLRARSSGGVHTP